MNINIPNNVIWANAYKLILSIAVVIACFTSDPAYRLGSLFSISLICVGIAHFAFKSRTEYAQSLAKAVAALIPVFFAISYINSDRLQSEAIDSMRSSLTEEKVIAQKSLDGNFNMSDADKSPSKPVDASQFANFKIGATKEEMLSQASGLMRLSTQQTNYVMSAQTKLQSELNLPVLMKTSNLSSTAGAQKLKSAAQQYDVLIERLKKESAEFNAQYKVTFYRIATNFPAEIAAFDKSMADSVKSQSAMYKIQTELTNTLINLSDILIAGYRNQQIKYDQAQDKLLFVNDSLLNSYNAAIIRFSELGKQEDEILQNRVNKLNALSDKIPAK
jgi:hypothetical protein